MNRIPYVLTMVLLALLLALPATTILANCCAGTTGNVDGSVDGVVDISDVFAMVDYLGASIPLSSCPEENDVNKDGTIDISDLFALIDYLSGATALLVCPPVTGIMTDIDGNIYPTVPIGTQTWMAKNLKVTHYRNGEVIPNVTNNATWSGLTTGAYCNYNNDSNYVATYGRLYNWYAATDSRNIAPTGWHVPSDAEWQTLVNYLGGFGVAGGKMKEVGTTHWLYPNLEATNETGFSGLPGGNRYAGGGYNNMGSYGNFWSSTEYYSGTAWFNFLYHYAEGCYKNNNPERNGLSVRCVKD